MIPGERLIDCLARRVGQRLLRQEILLVARMAELAAALSKPHCRDEHMDVGMEEHPPRPGMQDRYEPDVPAKELAASAKGLQPTGNGCKERRNPRSAFDSTKTT